ncbi:hypothetical protein M8J76_001460 [Diaphorina citri]|nr:hypothetical protein M8J75_011021 [Diaphorina citri]KAI5726373.1 hypothetical protein M8J76_001460 [Diaphorina citri]
MRLALVLALLFSVLIELPWTSGKRGRGRGSKSRIKGIGVPITGKYRDQNATQYYNNNDGAKIIMHSHFDYEYVLGHKIVFICMAKGKPRPHITWFKDGVELYAHMYVNLHEWHYGTDRIKSKIEIDPATQMDAGIYECYADNMYNVDTRTFKTDFSITFD